MYVKDSKRLKRKKLNINLFAFTCFMLALGTWGLFFALFLRSMPYHSHARLPLSLGLRLSSSYSFFRLVYWCDQKPRFVVWHTSISLTSCIINIHFGWIVIVQCTHTLLGIVVKTENVLIWSGGAHFFYPSTKRFCVCRLSRLFVACVHFCICIFQLPRNTIRFNRKIV